MTAKRFLFVVRSLITRKILFAYVLKANPPNPNDLFERFTARGRYENFIAQHMCQYPVFDNLLKIRSLRATGEIKLKAALPNFGKGVTNYVYLKRREIGRESGFSVWLDGRDL